MDSPPTLAITGEANLYKGRKKPAMYYNDPLLKLLDIQIWLGCKPMALRRTKSFTNVKCNWYGYFWASYDSEFIHYLDVSVDDSKASFSKGEGDMIFMVLMWYF